ncbi:MAG: hypothetical protein ABI566_08615 [Pseudolysinimonas sp.]
MRTHRQLDPALGPVFTVADARAVGETPGRLRGTDLAAPFRGVRATSDVPAWLAYAPLLRTDERFSHTTAALLWGAPLPSGFDGDVHTSVPLPTARAKGAGVLGHQSASSAVVIRHGVPVSTAADTFLELAAMLPLSALVAVGDHLVLAARRFEPSDPRPYVSIDDLGRAADQCSGRGARRARAAVRLLRPGVESPMETRLRLQLTGGVIPEPVCGYELHARSGQRVGWFDLAWPEYQVIAEYDGDQHRTSTTQYERDIRRFDEADAAGWKVIRVRMQGLLREPVATYFRVHDALVSRGWSGTSSSRPEMSASAAGDR